MNAAPTPTLRTRIKICGLTREQDAKRAGVFYTASEYDIALMLNGVPA